MESVTLINEKHKKNKIKKERKKETEEKHQAYRN